MLNIFTLKKMYLFQQDNYVIFCHHCYRSIFEANICSSTLLPKVLPPIHSSSYLNFLMEVVTFFCCG